MGFKMLKRFIYAWNNRIADNKVVHDTFMDSLNSVLEMQENLYTLMSEEDMYKVSTVSETKIKNTREKFNENLEEA